MQKKNNDKLLEDSLLRLRALEPEDLEILYKWENDTSLWIHGNSLSPYSKLALRQYISDAQSQDIYQSKQLRLMICLKENNETIGTIDLYDFDIRNQRIGVGILIDEEYRGNNYASNTLEIIKRYAFSFLRINQLYAHVLTTNLHSSKLFENMGFIQSGILKSWINFDEKHEDVAIYQLINLNK